MDHKKLFAGILLSFIFVFVCVAIIFGTQAVFDKFQKMTDNKVVMSAASISDGAKEAVCTLNFENCQALRPDENVQISAEAAILAQMQEDGLEKIVFKKNSGRQMFIASVTKMMTAKVALENYSEDEVATISQKAFSYGGELKAGEKFTVKNLLYAALIGSDNSAAWALSEIMGKDRFIEEMNRQAKDNGLNGTFFGDAVGFDKRNHSTAEDLLRLAENLIKTHPDIFEISSNRQFDIYTADGKFHHTVKSTNKLLQDQSIDWQNEIVGGKTGTTFASGECLVLVLKSPDSNGYLISVVLDSKDRFGDVKKIINSLNLKY